MKAQKCEAVPVFETNESLDVKIHCYIFGGRNGNIHRVCQRANRGVSEMRKSYKNQHYIL